MNQLAFGDNLSPYNRLASIDGIEYAYSIDLDENDFWVCKGYALANGHRIATWFYHADTFADARSEDTKLYLLRELKPMAESTLRQLSELYTRHSTFRAVN